MWALPALPVKPPSQAQAGYKGVIELWNVEAFEGGSGSRSSWLTGKSAKFEKANTGLFVHVTDLTVTELADKLKTATLNLLNKNLEENGDFFESYNPDDGSPFMHAGFLSHNLPVVEMLK